MLSIGTKMKAQIKMSYQSCSKMLRDELIPLAGIGVRITALLQNFSIDLDIVIGQCISALKRKYLFETSVGELNSNEKIYRKDFSLHDCDIKQLES